MEILKLNVLHMHLCDAQSFPVYLPNHPELAKKSAWGSNMMYSRAELLDLIVFAADRGIRVVPEVDIPVSDHMRKSVVII